MKRVSKLSGIAFLAMLSLIAAGCLVSVTFVIEEELSFTTSGDVYFYEVDVTDEEDWEDHKDNIDKIVSVGFELYITNNESLEVEFNGYIDRFGSTVYTDATDVENNATLILDGITLPAGPGTQTHITYGQSFQYVRNVDSLRTMALEGQFHAYGISAGGTAAGFTVDSGLVVVTYLASE